MPQCKLRHFFMHYAAQNIIALRVDRVGDETDFNQHHLAHN